MVIAKIKQIFILRYLGFTIYQQLTNPDKRNHKYFISVRYSEQECYNYY